MGGGSADRQLIDEGGRTMDIVIRFVGLLLLSQAGGGGPYRAVIPQWKKTDSLDMFCGAKIMEHRPYIRVPRTAVVNDSKWKKLANGDKGLGCVVYSIPDGTTLSIDPGFPFLSQPQEQVSCFVPDIRAENLATNPKLRGEALTTLSATDYLLPPGHLLAGQFKNDQIFTKLIIPAPSRSAAKPIRIVATPRTGSPATTQELVVAPGTTIDIVSA